MPVVRIRPRSAPLWRSPRQLQFGLAGGPLLDDPLPWQERVVALLERGIEAQDVAGLAGAPERLAMLADAPPDGTAELVRRLAAALESLGPPTSGVVVRSADALGASLVSTVVDALTEEGWPAVWLSPGDEPAAPGTPTVLLAAHVMPPHLGARCMSIDRPHLPIVFTGSGAEVGPFVRPGRTACLACLDAHRTDADTAWPTLMSQLLLRRPPVVPLPLAVHAASLAAGLCAEAAASGEPERARSAVIEQRTDQAGAPGRAVTWRTHRPHPGCLCGSPGTTGRAAGSLRPLAPDRGDAEPRRSAA